MANEQQNNQQQPTSPPRPPRRGGPGGFGGGGPMVPGEKPKDFKGSMGKLISMLMNYRWRIIGVVICAILSTVFAIVGPTIMGNATTELFNGLMRKIGGTGGIDFVAIGKTLMLLLGLYGVSALFSLVQGFLMTGVANNMTFSLRTRISEKIHKLPLKYYESRTFGEILSRITNDIDTLGQGLNQSLTQLITSVSTLVGVFIMMLRISVWMTLVTVLILPLSIMLIALVMKRTQKYFRSQQQHLGEINGQVEEVYGGLTIVKAFNQQQAVVNQFETVNEQLFQSAWRAQTTSGIMMPIMQFIGNLGYVAVAILGGYLSLRGMITVGDIQAFIQYVRNFTQPIQQIAQITNLLQSTAAASERVFEFLDEPEEQQTVEHPAKVADIQGDVTFDHVRFGYDEGKAVINDFCATIKRGQKVAIVGPTGAGKTTIVKLLMRFYDVQSGEILLDGINLTEFDRNELRQLFGMVLQDTWLFNDTIMENIRYGRLDATDEEVIEAAKAAYVDHYIMTQPDGYNMIINEESTNLSQGQKQLLTIARAILADNRLLILDEATSSVDTRTEVRIQMAMDRLLAGRTSFVIAHRLSTIKNADLILVMNEGDIVEQGTHEQLLAAGGFYYKLYHSQFESAEE